MLLYLICLVNLLCLRVIAQSDGLQRVDRIQSTLSSDLDHLFSTTVITLTDRKDGSKNSTGPPEADKTKRIADVTECLLTYDSLGLWKDAEDILRRDVVHEFIKKVGTNLRLSVLSLSFIIHNIAGNIPRCSFSPSQPHRPTYSSGGINNPTTSDTLYSVQRICVQTESIRIFH